ncbi:MAG: hypothetical protein K2K23_03490, partial [Muribaculaceae bacterium]|nr:hypothetical protein [Muribaculaceae bacterium]
GMIEGISLIRPIGLISLIGMIGGISLIGLISLIGMIGMIGILIYKYYSDDKEKFNWYGCHSIISRFGFGMHKFHGRETGHN